MLVAEVPQDQARNLGSPLDMRRAWQGTSLAGREGSKQDLKR